MTGLQFAVLGTSCFTALTSTKQERTTHSVRSSLTWETLMFLTDSNHDSDSPIWLEVLLLWICRLISRNIVRVIFVFLENLVCRRTRIVCAVVGIRTERCRSSENPWLLTQPFDTHRCFSNLMPETRYSYCIQIIYAISALSIQSLIIQNKHLYVPCPPLSTLERSVFAGFATEKCQGQVERSTASHERNSRLLKRTWQNSWLQ